MRLLPTFFQVQNDIVKAAENIPYVFIHKSTLDFLIIVDKQVIRFATIYTKGNAGYDVLVETFGYVCFRAYIHRLIGAVFVHNPRPDIFDRIDHIDRNTKNNAISNLRWVNHKLNMINTQTTNVRMRTYFRSNGKLASYWKKSFGKYAYEYSERVAGELVKIRIYFDDFNTALEFGKKDKIIRFNKLYAEYINECPSACQETSRREGEVHSRPVLGIHDSPLRLTVNRPRYCRFA